MEDENQKDDAEKAPWEWWLRKAVPVKDLRYKVHVDVQQEKRAQIEAHRYFEGIYGYL